MIVPNGAVAAELVRRGRKLGRLLLDGRFRAGLRHGVAATIEHEAALAGRGFASVVDIGAHRGQFALFCSGLYPNARIFAFEPLPGPYAVLARIAAERPGIRTHQAAIGPHAGPARMHVMHPDDCSSLLAPSALQSAIFRGSGARGVATVALAPLDSFVSARELAAPSLLKIDVQGFELEALKGCAGLLDRFAAVYVECSFERLYADQALADEVLAHLAERGFELRGMYNAVSDRRGRAVQADFLCARR
jgi:FkbM family methyltransferase